MAIYGRSRRVMRFCFGIATVLMLAALVGLFMTRELRHPFDVYMALLCGIVVWGWQVSGYYLGFVTGPYDWTRELQEKSDSENRSLLDRFKLAVYFSLHHELMVLGIGALIAALVWSQPNKWGLWMYIALWLMHTSAKVNVFLGVRNFRVELLPQQMHHLDDLLGKRHINLLFPVSIILASSIAIVMLFRGISPGTPYIHTIGYLSIATMMGLGLLEHWLLVLPLSATLWGWGIRTIPKRQVKAAERTLKAPTRSVSEQVVNG